MTVKLEHDDSTFYLRIPEKVLDELEWNGADYLEIDISMTEPHTLLVYPKEKP